MFVYVPTCDAAEVINNIIEHPWHDGQYCPSVAIFAEFIRQGDLYADFESVIDYLRYDDCNLPELIGKIAGDEKYIAKMMGKLSDYEDFVYRPADVTEDANSGYWFDLWDFGEHYRVVVHHIEIGDNAPLIDFYGFGYSADMFHTCDIENLPDDAPDGVEFLKGIAIDAIKNYIAENNK